MITAGELLKLLSDIESDRVERTIATKDTDKFSKAVAALANDLADHRMPGYLVVGARDDGSLNGLKVTDELLQNLAALRSDGNIQPLPAIQVAKIEFPGGDVALVEVQPSDLPPVRYKGQIWIRVGPRSGIANEQEERILTEKRIAKARSFDALPCLGSALDDLSADLFRINYLNQAVAQDVLAENNRTFEMQLASLRFFDLVHQCPTNAGVLLFGKNPLLWLPGAYIQFLRLSGPSLNDDILNERRLSGDLLTVLRELESLLEIQIREQPVAESLLRERITGDYPPVALRELTMNAVMHRSYDSNTPVRVYWFSDRVEIQSPGGLYGEASPENFPNQNSYRNPVLAEAMKTLGFVNKFGRGVFRAQAALQGNANPPAEFAFDHGYVRATVRVRP
jgi:ATP-dependent DNA helicase RecG